MRQGADMWKAGGRGFLDACNAASCSQGLETAEAKGLNKGQVLPPLDSRMCLDVCEQRFLSLPCPFMELWPRFCGVFCVLREYPIRPLSQEASVPSCSRCCMPLHGLHAYLKPPKFSPRGRSNPSRRRVRIVFFVFFFFF